MRIYDTKFDFIICGDFNINYLHNDSNRYILDTLLMTYSLTRIVHFHTWIDKETVSIIDHILIDKSTIKNYTIIPSLNGLSYHDAQMLRIDIKQNRYTRNVITIREK